MTQALMAPSVKECPRAPECDIGQPLRGEYGRFTFLSLGFSVVLKPLLDIDHDSECE